MAVLFDLDATLVDTPTAILRTMEEALTEAGAAVGPEQVRATIGRPLAASVAVLLGRDAADPTVDRAVARFRRSFAEQVLPAARGLVFPGIPRLLADLRAAGTPLAVVTSKVERSAVELLDASGLSTWFDAVVGHDMAERGKPHPDLALLAAERLGVSPADCVVVGDGIDDIQMAVAAGMAGYGVSWGVASGEQLRSAGARRVLDSVEALAAVLTGVPEEQWSR